MPAPGPAPCCAAPQGMEEGGDKRRVDAGEDEAELDELSPTEALLEVSTHSPAAALNATHPHSPNSSTLTSLTRTRRIAAPFPSQPALPLSYH